jgi:hypothetical protein
MNTNKSILQNVCRAAFATLIMLLITIPAWAADPGALYPTTSDVSDQKMGSLLFFNYYTSSSCCPSQENTRINLTNTHPSQSIMLHLFFVDGTTCSVADSYLPLVRNQTTTFVLSDVDPGVMGYMVAVAVDGPSGFWGGGNTGRPVSYNWVVGDEYVELASGHEANLAAESFAVVDQIIGGSPVPQDPAYLANTPTASLVFNGTPGNYNRAPQLLALSSMPSPSDSIAGYNTQLVLNRIGGSLVGSALPIGPLFGLMYNDASMQLSFTFSSTSCQFRSQINRNFPRTTPRPNQLIPEGRTGWAKFYSMTENVGLLGAVMIANNSGNNLSLGVETLNGGRNLHKLRLANQVEYIIPVFPPN